MASIELAKAYVQIVPSAEGLGKSITSEFESAGDEAGSAGGKRAGSSFSSALGVAAKAAGAALAAAGTAVGSIVKSAVSDFAEYEQLVGGVETLFQDSADAVQQYAANAYQTAGMSANEYMETVTGFSASLLQSLDGDTSAAAAAADSAITDMADNANKMGTAMESIQNAYSGFAKGNFTMLDNLKLGYGGTAEEMQRLLNDAEEMAGLELGTFDISSFADITEAIHIVQENMGIAGTTAKEASTTISGSLSSMKGAWSNLLVGMADGSQDVGPLIDNLVESAMTFGENLVPVLEQSLSGVAQVVEGLAPIIVDMLPGLVETILPGLVESATSIVTSLVEVLPSLLQTVITALVGMTPQLVQAGITLFVGLIGALPEIISTIVAALPQIIGGIVSALISAQPELTLAGIELFLGLIANLPAIIAGIIGAIPQIIESLVSTITGSSGELATAGHDLMMGFKQGIVNSVTELWEAMKAAVNSIIDGAKRLLGIASPSKVFAELGGYTMEGFAEGILKSEDLVDKAMSHASALATASFNTSVTASGAVPASSGVGREVADALRGVRVYIDGTRMVGYLVPGIDTALGVRQNAALRGAI